MITRKVIGIDPDTVLSGWCEAQISSDGNITHTLELMSESAIQARLELFKKEGIAVIVAVENSWVTALGKSIPLTYNTKKPMSDYERAKIAGNVAVNHATGQRIARLVESILRSESLTYYYPNNGKFGKNSKYSQQMYEDICKSLGIVAYKRTNEEKRDAFRACLLLIDGLKSDYKRMIRKQSNQIQNEH
jgi:hypothetical protein